MADAPETARCSIGKVDTIIICAALQLLLAPLRLFGLPKQPLQGAGPQAAVLPITNDTDETIDLNGDSFSVSMPTLALDGLDFFNNAPFFLDPGASSGPFDIFAITISPTAASGTVGPNIFQVLGGPDGNTFDVLGTAAFNVEVEGSPTVPEPSGMLLLLCGITALVLVRGCVSGVAVLAAAGFPQRRNS